MNQNYYDEKLKTLSENLQYAVIMSDWKKSLIEIQNQFKLHIDQTQVLEDSTIRLMFGDIDAPDFINNMFNDAHVNSETAADILLEIDLKILKKIRDRLEALSEQEKKDEEIENILLDDEERQEKEISDIYAGYYDQIEKIQKETEEEMLKEGILPDGSNITDEMLGIKTEIPSNIDQEKIDLLKEIEEPTKSFKDEDIEKDFGSTIKKIEVEKTETNTETISTDHQIQNTHLEKPFKEEDIIHEVEITSDKSTKDQTQVEDNKKPNTINIKRPIDINLNDIYREPIE